MDILVMYILTTKIHILSIAGATVNYLLFIAVMVSSTAIVKFAKAYVYAFTSSLNLHKMKLKLKSGNKLKKEKNNMKQVHIGYHSFTNSGIVEEVANVLFKDDFNVELFGVDLWADELPNNYQIVDYDSRETLLVCEDGEIIDDADEIAEWEEKHCC
nr:MAG TPA: hypothetical protein [Caudoviricetes sp.]